MKNAIISRTVRAAVPIAAAAIDVFFFRIWLDSSKQQAAEILFYFFQLLFYFL